MSILVSEILEKVSIVLNDQSFVRWTEAELMGWINDAAAEVVIRRPGANAVTGVHVCTEGPFQRLLGEAFELMDVLSVYGAGQAIRRTDYQLLVDQDPDWLTKARVSKIKHFTFDDRSPTTFWVYPPAKAGTTLLVMYSEPPTAVTDKNQTLNMLRVYLSPIISFVLYRALSKDSEYANGMIASAHLQAFEAALGIHNQTAAAVTPNVGSV